MIDRGKQEEQIGKGSFIDDEEKRLDYELKEERKRGENPHKESKQRKQRECEIKPWHYIYESIKGTQTTFIKKKIACESKLTALLIKGR